MHVFLRKSGLCAFDPNYKLGDRKSIASCHAYRKFFTNQLVNSKVNPEIHEMLLECKIGLASAYYGLIKNKIRTEYEIGIDNLTINEDNRLKKKVIELQVKYDQRDKLIARINVLEEKLKS